MLRYVNCYIKYIKTEKSNISLSGASKIMYFKTKQGHYIKRIYRLKKKTVNSTLGH
jgi:hypothetical protein